MFVEHGEVTGIIVQKPEIMEPDVRITLNQLVVLKSQETEGLL
jgi:hypothetical protein